MLFGVFTSMILMIMMGRVVIYTFLPTMKVVSHGQVFGLGSFLGFMVIITMLMVSLAHRSYGLIHEIADRVLRYIGGMGEMLGESQHESQGRMIFAAAGGSIKTVGHSMGGDPGGTPGRPGGFQDLPGSPQRQDHQPTNKSYVKYKITG